MKNFHAGHFMQASLTFCPEWRPPPVGYLCWVTASSLFSLFSHKLILCVSISRGNSLFYFAGLMSQNIPIIPQDLWCSSYRKGLFLCHQLSVRAEVMVHNAAWAVLTHALVGSGAVCRRHWVQRCHHRSYKCYWHCYVTVWNVSFCCWSSGRISLY